MASVLVHAFGAAALGSWYAVHFGSPGAPSGAWLLTLSLSLPAAAAGLILVVLLVDGMARVIGPGALARLLRTTATAATTTACVAVADTIRMLALGTGGVAGVHLAKVLVLVLPLAVLVAAALELGSRVARLRVIEVKVAARRAVLALTSAAVLVGTAGVLPTLTAADAATPSSPCPAGAPGRSYAVSAINVDIPLNRFGDHDPRGRMYVLDEDIPAVREQEATQEVSIGLRDDPIQPLVIRANGGECLTINYTNNADGGDFGLHIDGLAFDAANSGDGIGRNTFDAPKKGESRTYTYWVPLDPTLEGAHYLRPGVGFRDFVNHGLFGALVVEPPGSVYLDPNAVDEAHAKPLRSGWEAIIKPVGMKSFRENVQLYHEIGNEDEKDAVLRKNGEEMPFVDPHTDAYRPGTRAINYRSEAFFDRLEEAENQEAHAYGSYTFGDPSTPTPRGYLGDPTKFRILHAGSEMFHVFHMHGGGIRWRFNPVADPTWDYQQTGLNKHPLEQTPSERLDSQSFGPGEAYNLEIEGGAGGVQQAAGDFLFHCHIAEHYVAGMWAFWRVYDTRQPDFAPLADRAAPPKAVTSRKLIGKVYGPDWAKQKITRANLDAWIRPQLPPQGVRHNSQDAAVWDWTTFIKQKKNKKGKTKFKKPLYLGEPEDRTDYPGYYHDPKRPTHPTALPGDRFKFGRPMLLFNPDNGRPAFPLMRPHLGQRPPFAPAGHSGAPYLGEMGDQAIRTDRSIDPWAARADGICPSKQANGQPTPLRRFNVVAIEGPVQVTDLDTDPVGKIYTLAHDKADVLSGKKPFEPLALRANVGDCVAVTLTSELTDANATGNFSQVNMHIHHVQFDTQASDGVITGMSYEQAVRPYKAEDPQLTAPARAGDTVLQLSSVAKFHLGTSIGVGLGTEGPAATGTVNPLSGAGPEIRTIKSIDPQNKTVTLDRPLVDLHPAGQWAGTEFVQYRWYPDVDLDNIFWHDHVDGIHTWAHGLVGQLITEPRGSTYHDPRTGEEVNSGTIVDIHTDNPLAAAAGVTGDFREFALWTMDKGFGKSADSMLNLRAEPLFDRVDDPATQSSSPDEFSSYKWGDPRTPLPRAYPGDPFVIRTINVGPAVDTLHFDGHDFLIENRYEDENRQAEAGSTDTIHYGISEKFTLILRGGAGGPNELPGDYLYFNGIDRRLNDGAWGLLRVLQGRIPSTDRSDPNYLQPLPGRDPGPGPAVPTSTGSAPPDSPDPGNPCPATAPTHAFDLTGIRKKDAPNESRYAYVNTSEATSVTAGREPMVMHVRHGECLKVTVRNDTGEPVIGFRLTGLQGGIASSGTAAGFNPDTTIAQGQSRMFTYYVDNAKFGTGVIADHVGDKTMKRGLYGSFEVAPAGSTFSDPVTGAARDIGAAVVVKPPNGPSYRSFSLIFAEDEKQVGANFMPYPTFVDRPESNLVNYRQAPRDDSKADAFSSLVHGDPATPILSSYAGDPVLVHLLVAPGSEQVHAINLGGLPFSVDPNIHDANTIDTRAVGPWEAASAKITGGAGGVTRAPGDYFYGDLRRVFTQAGMWGLQRVEPRPAQCPGVTSGQLLCLP